MRVVKETDEIHSGGDREATGEWWVGKEGGGGKDSIRGKCMEQTCNKVKHTHIPGGLALWNKLQLVMPGRQCLEPCWGCFSLCTLPTRVSQVF